MQNSLVSIGPIALGLAVVTGLFFVIRYAVRASEARKAELQRFAQRHGFTSYVGTGTWWSGDASPQLNTLLEAFHPFDQGHSRRTSALIYGQHGDFTHYSFDYQYVTGSGKNRSTHSYGVCAVFAPYMMPQMTLRPEHFGDRIAASIGFKDIQFEFEPFNRAYHVSGPDERTIYALLHERMIEFLLQIEPIHLQTWGTWSVVISSHYLDADERERVMFDLERFFGQMPNFIKKDLSLRQGPRF